MVTLAQAIARRGGAWAVWVRIEGLGTAINAPAYDHPTQYTFCTGVPGYAVPAGFDPATWLPYLSADALPRTLSERVDPLGGVRDAGEYTFSVVDRDNFLTSLLRWDAPQLGQLAADVTVGAGSVSIKGVNPGVINIFGGLGPTTIWIGQEALYVPASGSTGTPPANVVCTVYRGVHDSLAAPHSAGDPVYLYPPRLEGRTVRLGIVPMDANSAFDELELDQYTITETGFSLDFEAFTFKCASRLMSLTRTIGAASAGYYQLGVIHRGQYLQMRAIGQPAGSINGVWPASPGPGYEDRYFQIDDKEILRGNANPTVGDAAWITAIHGWQVGISITDRALLGTAQTVTDANKLWVGNTGPKVTTPLVAETADGIGSFRFSPGPTPSTSRSSGTWTQSAHWVDIILCLLLSSRTKGDGLELFNYPAGGPNHSSLEVGWGAGIPVARVDVASFLAVRDRTPDWRFPDFLLAKTGKLNELLNTQFLRPLGAYISSKAGRLTLVLPRIPYVGNVPAPTLSLLSEAVTPGRSRAALTASYDPANRIRAVLLKMRAPNGDEATVLISAGDYGGQISARDSVNVNDGVLELAIPSIRGDRGGTDVLVEQIGQRRLLRQIKTPLLFQARVDLAQYAIGLGDLVTINADNVPNSASGVRGINALPAIVIERSIDLDVTRGPPGIGLRLLSYGQRPSTVGAIAPSATIVSWDLALHVASVATNRFTDSTATAPLPNTEATQFAVGMRCKLINPDGTLASPAGGAGHYQTVTATGVNSVTFDGDWAATITVVNPGYVIVLADYDDARVLDQVMYVAMADAATLTVGATQVAPWGYGEP